MTTSKAQKAKSKAKVRSKAFTEANPQLVLPQLPTGAINPEVQAQQIAMQAVTQTVNPYHMMGAMHPNIYNPGNVVHGGYVPGS